MMGFFMDRSGTAGGSHCWDPSTCDPWDPRDPPRDRKIIYLDYLYHPRGSSTVPAVYYRARDSKNQWCREGAHPATTGENLRILANPRNSNLEKSNSHHHHLIISEIQEGTLSERRHLLSVVGVADIQDIQWICYYILFGKQILSSHLDFLLSLCASVRQFMINRSDIDRRNGFQTKVLHKSAANIRERKCST